MQPYREHPPTIPLRRKWPTAAAAVGTLSLVGYLTYRPVKAWYEHRQRCPELVQMGSSQADLEQLELRTYYFNDSARDDWSPLAAGKYRILVDGDCSFSAQCDVQEHEDTESRDTTASDTSLAEAAD